MAELNRKINEHIARQNSRSEKDFRGLSPVQMHLLRSSPLSGDCVVQWQLKIAEESLAEVPMLTLVDDLLNRFQAKEIKLTLKGNLPRKLIQEWYAMGIIRQDDIESGLTKLSSEDDYIAAQNVKYVLEILKWTKKRNGKLSITAKGTKALKAPRQNRLQEVFMCHFQRFNLAYFDGYEDVGHPQQFFGYLLFLLFKDGGDWKHIDHYSKAFLTAFPTMANNFEGYRSAEETFAAVFSLRYFKRSLNFYGLIRLRGKENILKNNQDVMATDLFRKLFKHVATK